MSRPLLSATERLLQRFCHDAVRKTLLMSSVTGLMGGLEGCLRTPTTATQPSQIAAPHERDVSLSAADPAAYDAAVPDKTSTTKAPSTPVLRATRRALPSSDELSPFPCAEPPETPDAHEAAVMRDDPAHNEEHVRRAAGEWEQMARTLSLDADYDFVEVVRVSGPGQGGGMEGDKLRPVPMVLARAGTSCSDALDNAKCEASVKNARTSVFENVPCDDYVCSGFDLTYALTTRGDEVVVRRNRAELVSMFANIDTASEAWLLLAADRHAYQLDCENPIYARQRRVRGGFELATRMYTSSCRPVLEQDLVYRVDENGKIRLMRHKDVRRDNQACVVSGRRPQALTMPLADDGSAGSLFSRMAYLERASVTAFAIMHDELRALGAPDGLLARVERARTDEVRHARVMSRWAEKHGHEDALPHVESAPGRTSFDIARENAVEGCVRELFGALVVRFQAARVNDPALRDELASIADDEAAHAALAFDVAAWLEPKLPTDAQASVGAAVNQAFRQLEAELAEPAEDQRVRGGMPSLEESYTLLQQAAHEVHVLRGWVS